MKKILLLISLGLIVPVCEPAPSHETKTTKSTENQQRAKQFKKITWKQKASQKFSHARQFIKNNKSELIVSAWLLGVAGCYLYLLHPERTPQEEEWKRQAPERERRRMEREEQNAVWERQRMEREHRWAELDQQFQVLMRPVIPMPMPAPLPNPLPGIVATIFQRMHNRNAFMFYWARANLFAYTFNHPNDHGFRNRIYQDAQFYGNETQEEFQAAQARINNFTMAALRQGMPLDLRRHLLAPELRDDIATVGFHHLRNNPHRIQLMPPEARAQLINAMTTRHLENLRTLAQEMRDALPHINMHGIIPVQDYQLPDHAAIHQIMTARVNGIIQEVNQGRQRAELQQRLAELNHLPVE